MRIGIRISPLASSMTGIPVYVHNIIRELSDIDSENEYFLYTNKKIPFKLELGNNFHIILVDKPYPKFQLWYQIGLPYRIKKDKLDLYHDTLFLLPFAVRKIPSIITIYDLSGLIMPEYHNLRVSITSKLIPSSIKRAKRIIAISEFTKNEIERLFPFAKGKIDVVLCGVNPDFHPIAKDKISEIRKKYKLPEKFIMFLGTIEPRKNLIGLLKAYSKIHKKISHKLVIVGGKGWKYSNIFETIETLQIKSDVIFTGFIPTEDLPAIYNAADIFVYPSIYEGFGIPLLESMASGTPVITSNISSMPEVVGEAGLLADPYSIEDIAEKIVMLAQDCSLRNILSEKGIERAKMFSWKKSAKKVLDIYKETIEE